MSPVQWFESLQKPVWVPSIHFLDTITTFLYLFSIVSLFYLSYKAYKNEVHYLSMFSYIVNVCALLLYKPVFYGTKSLEMTLVVTVFLMLTIFLVVVSTFKKNPIFAIFQTSYFLWSIFIFLLHTLLLIQNS